MSVNLGVSVVIPTYNRAALVRRAVENLLEQLDAGDEIIVADDASMDGTEEVLAAFGTRVRYMKLPHGGAGAARNAGIRAATRPLVAFLDSDDLWFADKLTLQRAVFARYPEVLYCFSNFGVRIGETKEIRSYLRHWHDAPIDWDRVMNPGVPFSSLAPLPEGRADFQVHRGNLYRAELDGDYILTSTLVVRREEAGDALHFAEDVATREDWECFARIARKGQGAYLDCETAWQCDQGDPRLSGVDRFRRATAALTILERVWGADPEFLATYRADYERVCAAHHLTRARHLLSTQQTVAARAELSAAGNAPLSWRVLSHLPGWLAFAIIATRRMVLWDS